MSHLETHFHALFKIEYFNTIAVGQNVCRQGRIWLIETIGHLYL